MEVVGQQSTFEACNLLGVPGISCLDVDDDEGDIVIGIRPKSSPQPRRRTSLDDDDSEPEPPLSGSRRVSFADAKGLDLVQVKEFALWDVPKLPGYDTSEGEGNDAEEYFLSPITFSRPLQTEELFNNVQKQKVELETLQLLPGTSILKGVIRVLNISFSKTVFIRTTLDSWSSHFDLLAEYIPGSSDGVTDCFSFKLTLVPPFGRQGARVDFCLRYETPLGIFWANNNDRNYALHCYQRTKEEKQKPQKKSTNKKSCLKTASQNFSVENISGKEETSLDRISTDLSNHGLETSTIKTTNVCNGQSGSSEEEKQKLQVEERQNSGRRSRRKAARMARVRTYFAQRNGGVTDNERDESPPEIKQAAPKESPGDKRTDVQKVLEGNKSEVVQPLKREPRVDDTSPAQNVTFNSESVKPESIISLTGCKRESEFQDNLVHSDNEPTSPKHQNIEEIVSKVDESSQNQDECCERTNSTAAVNSESLVSHSDFTFETVVAPLYQQVFGRVGSESQSTADWGNPVCAVQAIEDSNPHSERRQSSNTDQTEEKRKEGNIGENVVNNQELNLTYLGSTLTNGKDDDQASLSVTVNSVLECEDIPHEIDSETECTSEGPKPLLGVPQPENMFVSKNMLNPQIPPENSHLLGEETEENQSHDPQSQTTAESLQRQLPEHICTLTKTNQDETRKVNISPPSSSTSLQPCQTVPGDIIKETGQERSSTGEINYKKEDFGHYSLPTTKNNTALKEDNMIDILDEFNLNHTDTPVTTETESSLMSGFEYVKDFKTSKTSHGETNSMGEENDQMHSSQKEETKHVTASNAMTEVVGYDTEALMGKDDKDGDVMLLGPSGEETIEDPIMTTVPNQDEDVCSTNTTGVKNWEAMVEEEEYSVLISGEEIETEDVETIEQVNAEEKNEEKVEENMWDIKVKDVKEEKVVGLEDKKSIRKEEIGEIDAEPELDYIQITTTETVEEEKLAKEVDVEKTEEQEDEQLEKEKHFPDTTNFVFGVTNSQEDHGVDEWKETAETQLNNEGKESVESEDEFEPKEDKQAQESQDYKEENVVGGALLEDIKDEDLCLAIENVTHEEESFEEKLDTSLDNVENGFSAVVINGQEDIRETVIDNKYEWEGILTDEWENDQTGHDSTSAESDSDDEVELYMHCLRAVSAGAQTQKERNNETGLAMSKRPSISRSKLLSTPMPSITESLDEDQPLGGLQEDHEDLTTGFSAVLTASSGQESINRNTSQWRDIFSCGNISKTLLYTSLLVVFLVVAYHYDFLACFGLYLISAVWLCCQGERQPAKNNRIG